MSPRTRFAILVGSGCALGGMLLTGCGEDPHAGTNGVAKLPPKKIESRTRTAAESARSVRMSGTVVSKGKKFRLDMRLKQDGGVGEVTNAGSTFELLRVGEKLFLKADEAFYRDREDGAASGGGADADAARKLEGKYLKVPTDDPAYQQLRSFTDMDVLLDGFFVLDGKLATDGRGRVNGVETVVLTAAGGKGGSVEVALKGAPFPLRYQRAGRGGTIELSDYNKDFTLKAPDGKQVVDYGKQISGSGS